MKKQEIDSYGNVTFGETTELLIDIIEQIVILDLVKKDGNKPKAYKKKLERMYDGQGTYSKFGTEKKGSPQWYINLFFENILESKYNISPLARIIIDSFTWQFFFALTFHTPFEKLKSETAMLHLRKQVFCFIYNNLLRAEPLEDGSAYKISSDSIIKFLTDSYETIFFDIENDFKKTGKDFSSEIKDFWGENCKNYPKLNKTKSIEAVIKELFTDGGVFYEELKNAYSDLKKEEKKPKLYELLRSNEKADNFKQLFKEAVKEFIENDFDTVKIIIEEIPKFKINYPNFYGFNRSSKISNKVNYYLDDDILNWRNGDVYNPTWKVLEPILDFLLENDKKTYISRLVGLYLRKNAQRALEEVLDIFINEEQKKIIEDIKTMINNENRKPENFYIENDFEFLEQINLIYMCLGYQHQEEFDLVKSDEIISTIESRCYNSKKFFSPWLKARAKVFEMGETLKENKETQDLIINGYKKAFDEGIAYVGCYLSQFLLEAIFINKYCGREGNNYYGYGYALELFKENKEDLYNYIKESKNTELGKNFIDIHYFCNPRGKQIPINYPNLQHRTKEEAMLKYKKGLEYEKTGDFISAEKYFSEALILNPVYVNAYINRGNLYDKIGEQYTENALADFNIALLLDPQHENTLFNRGLLFLEKRQYEEAIKDFTEVININSKASDAYFCRGKCYSLMKNFAFAIQDFNKTIEIKPLYTEAYYIRGFVYKVLGDNDKAKEDYFKVKQIDPEFYLKNGAKLWV